MKKTYLFDLYGTLIDLHSNETKGTLWRSMARIYSMQGAPYTGPELHREYKRLRREQEERNLPLMRQKYNAPDMTLREVEADLDPIFGEMYEQKGVKATDEMIAFTAIAFRSISMEYIKLFDGVPEVLAALHAAGCKAYLLSNAQASFTRPEMESFGLYEMFDGVFLSSDVGIMKPSKYYYDLLISTFGLDKSDCVMVGNEYGNDVMAAHNYGISTVFAHTYATWDQVGQLPDDCLEISDIRDMLDLFNGSGKYDKFWNKIRK